MEIIQIKDDPTMIFFIYAAAFLLSLDNFPFMFGGGYKPLSLLFITLYVLFNIHKLLYLKFKRIEIIIFVILTFSIVITVFENMKNNYNFDGLIDATTSLMAGIVVYLGFKIFTQKHHQDDTKFIKVFQWIVRGYGLALFVGVLQLIYIYIFPNGALREVIHLFVNRDAYASASRVHFTFSEPSFISLHTNLLLLPAVIILKNKGYLTKNHKIIVLSFFTISLFSLSIRYFLDIFIFFIVYSIFTTHKKIFVKRFLAFMLAIFSILLILNVVFVQNVFHLNSDHFYRLSNIINKPSTVLEDTSFVIRSTYTEVGLESFSDRPLLGYGLGNFHYAYVDHLSEVDATALKQSEELRNAVNNYSLAQYNMFTRMLSELGVIGLLILLLSIYFICSIKGKNLAKMIVILVIYSQLQFDSLAFIQIYIWVALLQTKFISNIKIENVSKKQHIIKKNIKGNRQNTVTI